MNINIVSMKQRFGCACRDPMGFGARKQKGGITGSSGSHNPPSSSSKNGPSQGLLNRRLSGLVVDDNKVNRRVHRMLLSKLGVETQEAENGREAVDLCAAGMVFDLILMDMEMPIMDGPQVSMDQDNHVRPIFNILLITCESNLCPPHADQLFETHPIGSHEIFINIMLGPHKYFNSIAVNGIHFTVI